MLEKYFIIFLYMKMLEKYVIILLWECESVLEMMLSEATIVF